MKELHDLPLSHLRMEKRGTVRGTSLLQGEYAHVHMHAHRAALPCMDAALAGIDAYMRLASTHGFDSQAV
jgi:hypothetical protein